MKMSKIVCMIFLLLNLNLHAEIQEITFKVGGMVCTACVTTIKGALKGIKGLSVQKIDLGSGMIQAKLNSNNSYTLDQLNQKLASAVKGGTYKFQDIKNIVAKGEIIKSGQDYLLSINKNQKIKIPSSLMGKAQDMLSKQAILSGNIKKINGDLVIMKDEEAELVTA